MIDDVRIRAHTSASHPLPPAGAGAARTSGHPGTCGLSIVIPTLDEERHLPGCLRSLESLNAEVIVADGGSSDRTPRIAAEAGARVIRAPRGRGTQMHAGALASTGNMLLFLHADTCLSAAACAWLCELPSELPFAAATFRVRFDRDGFLYRLFAWGARFDSVWTSFSDQGILIARRVYDRIGGFPAWPLLEDVALLRAARRTGRIGKIPAEVTTSARRFERNGPIRQQLRNLSILTRFLLGGDPIRLASRYAVHTEPDHDAPLPLPAIPRLDDAQ